MSNRRPKYRVVKESDDVINWGKDKYKGFKIIPDPRDQGQESSCQFHAAAAGGDMGYMKSRADHGQPSDIHFQHGDLLDSAKTKFKIRGEISIENTPTSSDVLEIFESKGVKATCKEWPRERRKKIDGSSYGGPTSSEVITLIQKATPLLAHFDACKYLDDLKPNEVYRSPVVSEDQEKQKSVNVAPHLVLICGYGYIDWKVLYLIFLNSWTEKFCQGGFGRIIFTSISAFHTVEIHCHPQRTIPAKVVETIDVYCWGLRREVEKEVIFACPFIDKYKGTDSEGNKIVNLGSDEVTPLALCLIIKYLRYHTSARREKEKSSFSESFVKDLDIQTKYDVMRASDVLGMQNLAQSCASALVEVTTDWSADEFKKGFRLMKNDREWSKVDNKIKQLANSRMAD